MRVLYILDRGILGGIQRHVQCLAKSLQGVCEVAVMVFGPEGPLTDQMRADGIKTYLLKCRNGHDIRLFGRFEKALRDFRPDVIHSHMMPFFGSIWLKFVHPRIPLVTTLHLPVSAGRPGRLRRLCRPSDYYLAVSSATLETLKKANPKAKGEVLFNSICVEREPMVSDGYKNHRHPVVGMVARAAQIKDWPSFHAVTEILKRRMPDLEVWNLGETADCPNGREMIGKMDVMLMTSFSEQMPTVVLEAFAEGTAVCGFIPEGGTSEILALSNGAVRQSFLAERNCEKLADVVAKVLKDERLRRDVVSDGWQIVSNHFDAEKNCRGRLMEIYRQLRGACNK